MTAGRRWTPKDCCWKKGCNRSLPASSGWWKKGGAGTTDAAARTAAPWPGEDGGVVPRGADRLRLPQGSGQDPQQSGREEGQTSTAAVAAFVGADASGGQR